METEIAVDRDLELWVLVRQVSDVMERVRERELREAGISLIQATVLFAVKAIKGPATPAEVSRWVVREPHTVSALLNRMEKQGLVRKIKDLERKNLVRIALTKKGEEAYRQSRRMKVIPKILSCLSLEERDNLRSYFEILRNKALEELRLGELKISWTPPFP